MLGLRTFKIAISHVPDKLTLLCGYLTLHCVAWHPWLNT